MTDCKNLEKCFTEEKGPVKLNYERASIFFTVTGPAGKDSFSAKF